MFIAGEDYRVVVREQTLKVISQTSAENRANVELEARGEISGYPRPKYDYRAVFSAEGDGRDRLVVMCTYGIALYHMSAFQPQKMGVEIRKERYKRAIKWLEGMQTREVIPDLPLVVDEDEEPTGGVFTYSLQPPLKHNW